MADRQQREWLYEDGVAFVSPSWLIDGTSRYAIRTVARLEFSTARPPLMGVVFMLCFSLFLVGLSLYFRFQRATPELIPLIMLVASLTLSIGCVVVLWLSMPVYLVNVVMLDGSVVTLTRKKKQVAEKLLEGLSKAMDWHRNPGIEIDSQRSRHLRQAVAQGKRRRNAHWSDVWSKRWSKRWSKTGRRALPGGNRAVAGTATTTETDPTQHEPSCFQGRPADTSDRKPAYTGAGPVVAVVDVTLPSRMSAAAARFRQWLVTRQHQP